MVYLVTTCKSYVETIFLIKLRAVISIIVIHGENMYTIMCNWLIVINILKKL